MQGVGIVLEQDGYRVVEHRGMESELLGKMGAELLSGGCKQSC